jgi:multidrug resistance efflux pump
MTAAIVICVAYVVVVWLVFFKFRWLKFSIAWGVVSVFVGLHLLIIFLIGLRYVTPYSTNARVVQHTIQITPRLPEPTLVTDVLVEQNELVKKGTPLFQLDRRPYEYKVKELEAKLAAARQDVLISDADVTVSEQKVVRLESELAYAQYQLELSTNLAGQGAGPQEDVEKWAAQVAVYEADIQEAKAEVERAKLVATSDIGGVNTKVATIEAELDQARFYLDNTLIVAPEDGYIINLQVRPGMVAGDIRVGAIASFIVDADRYLLANFFQENLKLVKPGQPVEVALDLYPGQIWPGKVEAIWQGSGAGQFLPSGFLPHFFYKPTELPQGQFAVVISLDEPDQTKFPIGTQGRAAIYTDTTNKFTWMRKIGIRTYTWFNLLYPFSG